MICSVPVPPPGQSSKEVGMALGILTSDQFDAWIKPEVGGQSDGGLIPI